MRRYFVDDLQAADLEGLPAEDGVRVSVALGFDSMGLPRVEVEGPTPEAVLAYVRQGWGEDDADWFAEHVVARLQSRVIAPASPAEPRTLLVHLSVEVPADDPRTADEVADAIQSALRRLAWLEADITVPLAEEV